MHLGDTFHNSKDFEIVDAKFLPLSQYHYTLVAKHNLLNCFTYLIFSRSKHA